MADNLNIGKGPIHFSSQAPFQSFHLPVFPVSPSNLVSGQTEVLFTHTWSNIWAIEPGAYVFDYEVFSLGLGGVHQISPKVSILGGLKTMYILGGIMDGYIEEFHDLINNGTAYRDKYPRDSIYTCIKYNDVFYEKEYHKGFFAHHSAYCGLQYDCTKGDIFFPAIATGALVRFPLPGKTFGHTDDKPDYNVYLTLSKWIKPLYIYSHLSYTYYGNTDIIKGIEEINLRRHHWSFLLAGELPLNKNISLIIQGLYNSPNISHYYEFATPTYEITGGINITWKNRFKGKNFLEFSVIENLFHYNNSPDFGIHLGIGTVF
ncbi:MAG: DUF3187 family protein [Deltaproteobacteria bacterium]|nr:DUF3187 family protein [Deltaproteobacteria bacterium]